MRIKKFNENLSSDIDIDEYFIEFVDNKMIEIEKYDIKYYIRFNFKLPKSNSITEMSDNLKKASEYIMDINTIINRIKDYYKIDASFSNIIDFSSEFNFHLQIIDNSSTGYEKLTIGSYKEKKKKIIELDSNDILRVYNAMNINGSEFWFRGYSHGRQLFDKERNIPAYLRNTDFEPPRLLMAEMSILNVCIIDLNLYKLDTGNFLIDFDNNYFLIKNDELDVFLKERVEIKYEYLSKQYPRIKIS